MDIKINWSGRAIDYTQEELDLIVKVAREADPQTQGPYLEAFEAKFKKYLGVKNAFALTNATNALDLIAILSGLSKDDEIIVPGHTFCASVIPFGRTGAKLVWADIDPATRLISSDSIKKLVTEKTKAVLVVHLYGMSCDMDSIMQICRENDLILIEDCAQSIGAEYKGKKTGTFGDFAAFSLHAQKNITTFGEGGFIIVKDDSLAKKVPGLRHNGIRPFDYERKNYWQPAMSNVDIDIEGVWPYNFSMTEIQAALGTSLLDRLDNLNDLRIARAKKFRNALKEFNELTFQDIEKYPNKHVFHLMIAKYKMPGKTNSDLISILFNEYGIKAIVQYYPLYRYPLFQKMGFGKADCPHTDEFFDNMVSFPFHIWMSEKDFDYLIDSTRKALTRLRG